MAQDGVPLKCFLLQLLLIVAIASSGVRADPETVDGLYLTKKSDPEARVAKNSHQANVISHWNTQAPPKATGKPPYHEFKQAYMGQMSFKAGQHKPRAFGQFLKTHQPDEQKQKVKQHQRLLHKQQLLPPLALPVVQQQQQQQQQQQPWKPFQEQLKPRPPAKQQLQFRQPPPPPPAQPQQQLGQSQQFPSQNLPLGASQQNQGVNNLVPLPAERNVLLPPSSAAAAVPADKSINRIPPGQLSHLSSSSGKRGGSASAAFPEVKLQQQIKPRPDSSNSEDGKVGAKLLDKQPESPPSGLRASTTAGTVPVSGDQPKDLNQIPPVETTAAVLNLVTPKETSEPGNIITVKKKTKEVVDEASNIVPRAGFLKGIRSSHGEPVQEKGAFTGEDRHKAILGLIIGIAFVAVFVSIGIGLAAQCVLERVRQSQGSNPLFGPVRTPNEEDRTPPELRTSGHPTFVQPSGNDQDGSGFGRGSFRNGKANSNGQVSPMNHVLDFSGMTQSRHAQCLLYREMRACQICRLCLYRSLCFY